nr:MAG TPA: hypothetical protein [Caudoviricetes sp.]
MFNYTVVIIFCFILLFLFYSSTFFLHISLYTILYLLSTIS